MPRLLTVVLLLVSSFLFAQKIPLINSGQVIERAKAQYDSEKYELAIKTLLTVPERDTNYVSMLSELALTYTANKEYDKAIAVCDKALKSTSPFRVHLIRTKAIALDKKGDLEKSISTFKQAIEKYPFDQSLIYNLGVTYFNNKEYQKAEDCFFRVLSFDPFHAGSHLNLGKMSFNQGFKTHAMMAFGMYLSIRPSDNGVLVLLNNMLGNQAPEEGKLPVIDKNEAGKLDQIIKAKLSMEKSFEAKIPIDAFVTRQYEMFFSQLASLPEKSDDRYLDYYLNLYRFINNNNMSETFIYHLLTSADNAVAKKWRNKNEKSLKAFFDQVSLEMRKKREVIDGKPLGFDGPVFAEYGDNNALDGLGKKDGEKNQGKWIYFYRNAEKAAEGTFDNTGKKTGEWKYYFDTGIIKSVENESTGEITMNFEDGNRSQHFFMKDKSIEGPAEVYYRNGAIAEKYVYKDNKRDGEGKTFYTTGKVLSVLPYSMGLFNGEVIYYFENGQVQSKTMYKNGKLEGQYVEYYANGKLKTIGMNTNDMATGTWKYYYPNGRVERSGAYANGKGVGEWMFYDARGRVSEKRTLEDGKFSGEDTYFKNGKKYFTETYKKDQLTKIVYYDTTGKEIWQGGKSDGTFMAKRFFNTGELLADIGFKKGQLNGSSKFYSRNGVVTSDYKYVDGVLQGEAFEYYETGAKKYVSNYVDGELHGYFQEFYSNGKVKQEGWYQNGLREQQWLSYFPNGNPETDFYYLNGEPDGAGVNYSVSGKIASITTYDKGRIIDLQMFDSKEKQRIVRSENKGLLTVESKFPNNKLQLRFELMNGDYVNGINKWYSDGSVFYTYPLMNGKRHGEYKYFDVTGKLLVTGQYVDNVEQGPWKYFTDEGTNLRSGYYLNGEPDSAWTYYHPNGKVSSTAEFLEKEREGISRFYTPEGVLMMEKLYSSGDPIAFRTTKAGGGWNPWTKFTPETKIVAYNDAGKIIYEESYKNGLRDGIYRQFYANGNKSFEYQYKNGDYQGPFTMYYANGKVKKKGQYVEDQLDGKVESFNEDGSLRKVETYVLGTLHGPTTLYNKGVKTKELFFQDDMIEQ